MRHFRDPRKPDSLKAKTDAAAQWGLLGLLLGIITYPIIWQIIMPVGQPPGAGFALVLLLTSLLGWSFPLLMAASLALVPLVAAAKSTDENYESNSLRLALRWLTGVVVAAALVIVAARAKTMNFGSIPLLLLLVPLVAAALVWLGSSRGQKN
jgi:hypothetical protein